MFVQLQWVSGKRNFTPSDFIKQKNQNKMKPQTTKKLLAFIVVLTILSALPELVIAQTQKKCNPRGKCPNGYHCYFGYCVSCARCPYFFLTDGSSVNEVLSISSANSNAVSFLLTQAQNVSARIYDATGRLVKTLVDNMMLQGEYQIDWDRKDAQRNAVSTGTYILQLNVGGEIATRKLSVVR